MDEKPRIERSVEKLGDSYQERTFGINGLKDVPRSIIPVPFYKLVQSNSSNVILPNGQRAPSGVFLMQDSRKTTSELKFIIVRAKRQTREQRNDFNELEKIVSLNVLGINLENKKPFILSVPLTSFSAFGMVFDELEGRKAINAWDYEITATTLEKHEEKETPRGQKQVDYWVTQLQIGSPSDPFMASLARDCYDDFAIKLDRNEDEDDIASIAGKVFNNNNDKTN